MHITFIVGVNRFIHLLEYGTDYTLRWNQDRVELVLVHDIYFTQWDPNFVEDNERFYGILVDWLDVTAQDRDHYTGWSYWAWQLHFFWDSDMRIILPGSPVLAPGLVTPFYYFRFIENTLLYVGNTIMEIIFNDAQAGSENDENE